MRRLFKQFQKASDAQARGSVVERIIEALTMHTYIENECLYPETRSLLPDLEQDVLESYEEHHVADVLCAELAAMSPQDGHFEAKATVLMENVLHHVEEEEQEWFPKVREGLSRKQLQDIGVRLLEQKTNAPRRPDEPQAQRSAGDAVTA